MLEVKNLSAAYGQHPSLNEVKIHVDAGEIVVILGANGAGKSTLLRAVSGICEGHVTGEISLKGSSLIGLSSDEIVERGVALVPEGRGIFGDLTVQENLLLGAYSPRARAKEKENLARVLQLFPKLRERQSQVARTMSGGEQQMVAIGRAMMSDPEILMLDEPSLGLSPLLCKELFQNLKAVKDLGIGVLLVEQNAKQSLAIADRGYLLENTKIIAEDSAQRMMSDPAVQKAYLGAGSKSAAKPGLKKALAETPTGGQPFAAKPVERKSAEQHIGGSIDDLVAVAVESSSIASTPNQKPCPQTQQAAEQLAQSRIEVVLKDMETAAEAARRRAANPSRPSASTRPATSSVNSATSPAEAPADQGAPPVIEVYKRPKVEVYRRRPSGQFERD